MGILTGKFTNKTIFPDGDLRKDWPNEIWFQEDLQTVEKLRLLSNKNQTLGQLALRYVLSHPAVSVVILVQKQEHKHKKMQMHLFALF